MQKGDTNPCPDRGPQGQVQANKMSQKIKLKYCQQSAHNIEKNTGIKGLLENLTTFIELRFS